MSGCVKCGSSDWKIGFNNTVVICNKCGNEWVNNDAVHAVGETGGKK